jgi:flagellar biosynthesis protein FlhG
MQNDGNTGQVIALAKDRPEHAGAKAAPEVSNNSPYPRVIAITSGKGGVGKTNIVANLGFALCQLGQKVLIFDADLGLANLDVLLGLTPRYNLSHVIQGEKRIAEIVVSGPGDMQILPASSGVQEMTKLSDEQRNALLQQLEALVAPIDVLLIDTAAGISSNVLYFNVSAHDILVVVTPEPTAITDAYALMKVLSLNYAEKHFKLLVNQVANHQEAQEVFRHLKLVADRFLNISIQYMGHVLSDKNLPNSVRRQSIVSEIYPDAPSTKCFAELAQKVVQSQPQEMSDGKRKLFWKQMFKA